ncbi:hypothetical protein ACKVMT_04040 [Halobacteriales archaeon Cl-PHB]
MSDSQAYEEVTVGSDGVTLTKRFEEDEFPVPAIAFEFSSDRDEDVSIRMVDEVPDGVEVEDLGFHPEYGSEYWTIDEDRIAFERDLEANAEYTTVYGIRATGTDDVEQFLTTPAFDEVDPPLPEGEKPVADDVVPESDDDVVRDVISGESDSVPGLDDEDDEEVETLDLKDPNDPNATAQTRQSTSEDSSGGQAGADAETEETDSSSGATPPNSVVAAMAAEIRQQNVSADDVKLLRRAFEIAGQQGGSVQARIQNLQTEVADLKAYTDALEEFLDDNGTAQQMIDDFEADLETIESNLESMQSDVSAVESEVQDNSEELSSVSDEVGSMTDDVANVSQELEGVEDTVEDLQASVEDLESKVSDEDAMARIEEIEDELEDLQTWQDQIKETFGG